MKSSREPIELNYESFSETYAAPKVSSQRKSWSSTQTCQLLIDIFQL